MSCIWEITKGFADELFSKIQQYPLKKEARRRSLYARSLTPRFIISYCRKQPVRRANQMSLHKPCALRFDMWTRAPVGNTEA